MRSREKSTIPSAEVRTNSALSVVSSETGFGTSRTPG